MAVDMFIQMEPIKGESSDDKHKEWIEMLSFSQGVTQPVSAASRTGGRTGGRADFSDFVFQKVMDKATPELNKLCALGQHIATVNIELCLASEEKHVFMKYELSDVIISSISVGGSQHDESRPIESVSLAFGKIKWEYTPIDQTGKGAAASKAEWDLEANKAG